MEVPVQYFQSVIAVETAVTGVLLFQIRFFETDDALPGRVGADARVRLLYLLILIATVFGSLEAIREGGGRVAASTEGSLTRRSLNARWRWAGEQ